MAGMHTKGMNQEGFDIENFPITFLAIRDEECRSGKRVRVCKEIFSTTNIIGKWRTNRH